MTLITQVRTKNFVAFIGDGQVIQKNLTTFIEGGQLINVSYEESKIVVDYDKKFIVGYCGKIDYKERDRHSTPVILDNFANHERYVDDITEFINELIKEFTPIVNMNDSDFEFLISDISETYIIQSLTGDSNFKNQEKINDAIYFLPQRLNIMYDEEKYGALGYEEIDDVNKKEKDMEKEERDILKSLFDNLCASYQIEIEEETDKKKLSELFFSFYEEIYNNSGINTDTEDTELKDKEGKPYKRFNGKITIIILFQNGDCYESSKSVMSNL